MSILSLDGLLVSEMTNEQLDNEQQQLIAIAWNCAILDSKKPDAIDEIWEAVDLEMEKMGLYEED